MKSIKIPLVVIFSTPREVGPRGGDDISIVMDDDPSGFTNLNFWN